MERAEKSDIISSVPTGTEEDSLVKQNLWCQISALFEKGMKKTAIARELGLDVKTVRKWIRRNWTALERQRGRALDEYQDFLRARAPEAGDKVTVLFREARGRGYGGSYPSLVKYVRPWRVSDEKAATAGFKIEPGHQAQVDWGSAKVWFEEGP
jgi:transposase